jgi:hypothetical protein
MPEQTRRMALVSLVPRVYGSVIDLPHSVSARSYCDLSKVIEAFSWATFCLRTFSLSHIHPSSRVVYHSDFVLRFCLHACHPLCGHGPVRYLERRYQRATMVRASTRLPWGRLRHVFVTSWQSWLQPPWFILTVPNVTVPNDLRR